MSLVLQIAGGIILAVVAIAMAPIVVGSVLGTVATVTIALTKPRRGILTPIHQTKREWWTTSLLQLGGVGVAFAVLVLWGYLSGTHAT
jgi:hypothetical protein